jgi:hypothetical protein
VYRSEHALDIPTGAVFLNRELAAEICWRIAAAVGGRRRMLSRGELILPE